MKIVLLNSLINFKKYAKYLRYYKSLRKDIPVQDYSPIPQNEVINYNMNRYNGPERYICLAPFTNLFFDIRGKVVVCNQNRTYTIGDIHQQTIGDIWNGERLKEIRRHLENFDFGLGCNKCADAILSKNYHGLPALSYDSTPTVKKNYPIRMEFEMGNTCNLACKMCNSYFSSSYKKYFEDDAESPIPYPDNFIDQLMPYIPHLQYTKFTGGEPFLIPEYFKIWEKIIELNPTCGIHIQTNGLVLNNKVKSILERGKFFIGVSLDGSTKETYEAVRIYGNFERLNNNLLYFKEYCKKKNTILNIPFTPTRDTLYEIQKFPDFANQYDAYAFFNIVWEPHTIAIWTLSSSELERALAFHKDQIVSAHDYLSTHNKKQYDFYVKQIEQWLENAIEREKTAENYKHYSDDELIDILIHRLLNFENYDCRVWINDNKIKDPEKIYRKKFYKKLSENPKKIRNILINLCTYDVERVYMEMSSFSHLW